VRWKPEEPDRILQVLLREDGKTFWSRREGGGGGGEYLFLSCWVEWRSSVDCCTDDSTFTVHFIFISMSCTSLSLSVANALAVKHQTHTEQANMNLKLMKLSSSSFFPSFLNIWQQQPNNKTRKTSQIQENKWTSQSGNDKTWFGCFGYLFRIERTRRWAAWTRLSTFRTLPPFIIAHGIYYIYCRPF
jgi:hypothetical protein